MQDWHDFVALFRHPLNSAKRKLHRRRLRKLPLSPKLRAHVARRALESDLPRRSATDALSIVGSSRLSLPESDLGTSDCFFISLTTTPIRAVSEDFLTVLDSLCSQRRKAKQIFLALPEAYRRDFAIDWQAERPRVVERIQRRYGERVHIIECEDVGPATKLLGLLGGETSRRHLGPSDRIIVVDDDILYSPELVFLHELCHELYQCDIGAVDQNGCIESWLPLRFRNHDALFSERGAVALYGWLGFSLRYDRLEGFRQFFDEAVADTPESLFHDDAIFSAFAKANGLYGVQINRPPLGALGRTPLDSDKGGALRNAALSQWPVRRAVERRLDALVQPRARAPQFYIPSRIAPRMARNCAGLTFCNDNRNLHFAAHYLDLEQILVTATVFDDALIGREVDVEIAVGHDLFRTSIRVVSAKFSFVLRGYRPLFLPLEDRAEVPIVQTSSAANVSRRKFHSICTILNHAPSREYLFFDEDRRQRYIDEHFSELVRNAYRALIPGAYRADLFRYLFAYVNVCVYLDVKIVLNVPLASLYRLTYNDQILVADVPDGYVYNAFFVSRRIGAELFRNAILLCLDRIAANDYCADALSVTGPGLFGAAKTGGRDLGTRLFVHAEGGDWKNNVISDEAGLEVIRCAYPGYYDEDNYLNDGHYSVLWRDKRVFGLPPSFFNRDCEAQLKGVDAIVWISLDRATERRKGMEAVLASFPSIRNLRIEAVDGDNPLPLLDGSAPGSNATAYEIACCLSHLKALEAALAIKGDYFLILEDDARLRFFPFLGPEDRPHRIAEKAPRDWEVILLSWLYRSELDREFTDWNLAMDDGHHIAGTQAYVIRRAAAEKMLTLFDRRDGKFLVKQPDGARFLNQKWLLADVQIFSMLRTYVYWNKLFTTENADSFIHPDHLAWHRKAQNVTHNHLREDIILRRWPQDSNVVPFDPAIAASARGSESANLRH